MARLKAGDEVRFLHEFPTGDVDEDSTALHTGELRSGDHVPRLGIEGDAENDDVGLGQQAVELLGGPDGIHQAAGNVDLPETCPWQ